MISHASKEHYYPTLLEAAAVAQARADNSNKPYWLYDSHVFPGLFLVIFAPNDPTKHREPLKIFYPGGTHDLPDAVGGGSGRAGGGG